MIQRDDLDHVDIHRDRRATRSQSASARSARSTLFIPWIRLRAPNGASLGSANNYQSAQIDATATLTGTYTVVVASADTARAGAGNYLLTLARTPAAFVVPSGDEGGAMTNGGNHAGAIHRGDLDINGPSLANQGDALSISIGEVGDVDLFVPWIRLRAPNGANLGSANNYQAAQINATRRRPGRTPVVASSADTARGGAGAYRLTIANTPGVFVVPAGDEGGVMTNGVTHQAAIHRGDLRISRGPSPPSEAQPSR